MDLAALVTAGVAIALGLVGLVAFVVGMVTGQFPDNAFSEIARKF
jgi:cbb3-type cytochrome oxidase maturation protein